MVDGDVSDESSEDCYVARNPQLVAKLRVKKNTDTLAAAQIDAIFAQLKVPEVLSREEVLSTMEVLAEIHVRPSTGRPVARAQPARPAY